MSVRMRITVKPANDRVGEMQTASDLRRVLWAHAPVDVDPEHPLHGAHRDGSGRVYIEFATEFPEEVRRVIGQHHLTERVELTASPSIPGRECSNCGNVAGPVQPAVCPNCGFHDIAPCPSCREPIPRDSYIAVSGSIFVCPHCKNHVRLGYNSPMFLPDGHYNQPLVLVAEALTSHEVR